MWTVQPYQIKGKDGSGTGRWRLCTSSDEGGAFHECCKCIDGHPTPESASQCPEAREEADSISGIGMPEIEKTIWICGKWIRDTDDGVVWEFQGAFSDEEKAITACTHRDLFIGPVKLDEALPFEKTEPWPGSYFPLRKPEDADYNNDRQLLEQ